MVTEQRTHEQVSAPAPDIPEHPRIAIDDGPVHAIHPELAPALAPATHSLHEWRSYRVLCQGAVRLELGSQSYDAIVEGVFQVQFENQIGLSRIRAFDASGVEIADRHVEVVNPKLGSVASSLAFLRAILADLTSERGALAYLPRAATSRTVREVNRPPSLLIQYFQLLNNAEAIAEALEQIRRNPHRVLDDESSGRESPFVSGDGGESVDGEVPTANDRNVSQLKLLRAFEREMFDYMRGAERRVMLPRRDLGSVVVPESGESIPVRG